ncbi:MAG: HYR domain-containing protein, partial [Proteobacteria bacterium]|nr:HYR domain-containing protein [Pseudomonadota bacterium]
SGSYLDTQAPPVSERLSEQHSGGKPSRRVSSLDHRWTIPGVVPSATVELYLRASAPSNGDDEDFDFTYSIDGGPEVPIGTLLNGGGTQDWTKSLPNDTDGTVVVRVVDTDRTAGNGGTDAVTVYEIHVTSAGSLGDLPPEVAITEPAGGTTIPVGTELVFSATVTDEDTNLAATTSWNSSLDGALGGPASIAVTLSQGTHVVTASVMDSASQPGSDSVSVLVLPPDTTPPVITAPADVTAEATGSATVVALGTPTVSDDIDPSPDVSNDAPASFPLGLTVVTWTATDASDNTTSDTQEVTVVETGTALSVTGVSPNEIVRTSLSGGVLVRITGNGFTASATVTFLNGSGPTPSASSVTLIDAGTLEVTVTGKSGPRKPRVWDVVVTLPGGVNAACAGCLTIIP